MLLVLASVLVSQNSPQHPEMIRAQRHAQVIADAERSKARIDRLMAKTDAVLAEGRALKEWCRAGARVRKSSTVEERAEAEKALKEATDELRKAEVHTAAVKRRNAEEEKAEAEKLTLEEKAEAERRREAREKARAAKRRKDD